MDRRKDRKTERWTETHDKRYTDGRIKIEKDGKTDIQKDRKIEKPDKQMERKTGREAGE